jgi:iron complex transport system ATP-binding protein
MIELRNVSKAYDGVNVVDDVSLIIEEGQITSFIGPNGAGKSTLLSIMSRLLKRDGGEVLIDGIPLEEWNSSDLAQRISILKQSNAINMRLTVRELVSFGRFPYSQGHLRSADWEAVEQALDYMKLTDLQDRYLHQLSGGQRQRAYIAMVIAQGTDYILLDEPLNNLDMHHAVEIMKTLRCLVRELGKTVVIVIHDINFASCYSDSIVVMDKGKIVSTGPPQSIIDQSVLNSIYNLDFHIEQVNNNRICVYY